MEKGDAVLEKIRGICLSLPDTLVAPGPAPVPCLSP